MRRFAPLRVNTRAQSPPPPDTRARPADAVAPAPRDDDGDSSPESPPIPTAHRKMSDDAELAPLPTFHKAAPASGSGFAGSGPMRGGRLPVPPPRPRINDESMLRNVLQQVEEMKRKEEQQHNQIKKGPPPLPPHILARSGQQSGVAAAAASKSSISPSGSSNNLPSISLPSTQKPAVSGVGPSAAISPSTSNPAELSVNASQTLKWLYTQLMERTNAQVRRDEETGAAAAGVLSPQVAGDLAGAESKQSTSHVSDSDDARSHSSTNAATPTSSVRARGGIVVAGASGKGGVQARKTTLRRPLPAPPPLPAVLPIRGPSSMSPGVVASPGAGAAAGAVSPSPTVISGASSTHSTPDNRSGYVAGVASRFGVVSPPSTGLHKLPSATDLSGTGASTSSASSSSDGSHTRTASRKLFLPAAFREKRQSVSDMVVANLAAKSTLTLSGAIEPPSPVTPPLTVAGKNSNGVVPRPETERPSSTTDVSSADKSTVLVSRVSTSEQPLQDGATVLSWTPPPDWMTLPELVANMIAGGSENVDFRNCFLLTMHYFTSPSDVLGELLRLLQIPPPPASASIAASPADGPAPSDQRRSVPGLGANTRAGTGSPVDTPTSAKRGSLASDSFNAWSASKLRVFSVLKHWIKMYFEDFSDPSVERALRAGLSSFPPLSWSHQGHETKHLRAIASSILDAFDRARTESAKPRTNPNINDPFSFGLGGASSGLSLSAAVASATGASPDGSGAPHHRVRTSDALSIDSNQSGFSFGLSGRPASWVPDSFTNQCMMCWSAFNFANRRHHCRRCGIVVCGACSDNKALVDAPVGPPADPAATLIAPLDPATIAANNAASGGLLATSLRFASNLLGDIASGTSASKPAESAPSPKGKPKLARVCDNCWNVVNTGAGENDTARSAAPGSTRTLLDRQSSILSTATTTFPEEENSPDMEANQPPNSPPNDGGAFGQSAPGYGAGSALSRTLPQPESQGHNKLSVLSPSAPVTAAETAAVLSSTAPTPMMAVTVPLRGPDLLHIPAQDIAFQLTLMAKRRFHEVESAREFLKGPSRSRAVQTVSESGDPLKPEQDAAKSLNQRQWQMRMSNQMSCWVSTEIIQCESEHHRAKMLQKFIKVGNICYQLKNFNTLFEIMTGIGHNSVYRLNGLFDSLPKSMTATYELLCDVVHYTNNYRAYRKEMKNAVAHGQVLVPYFGVMLRDLVAVEEGGSVVNSVWYDPSTNVYTPCGGENRKGKKDTAPVAHEEAPPTPQSQKRKLVNFAKCRQLFRTVTDTLATCQSSSYDDLVPNMTLQLRVLTGVLQAFDDKQLTEASFQIQPPRARNASQ